MNLRYGAVGIVSKCWNSIKIDEQNAFNLWAVGLEEFLICEFIPRWNRLHGDAFFINEDVSLDQAINVILKLWRDRQ
jgi:hypothetical protein